MRVILDTNVFLQSLPRTSSVRPIWDAFLGERIQLHVTTDILLEYEEQLGLRASPLVAKSIAALMEKAANAHLVRIHFRWNAVPADPDDNKFFDAAVAASADYLVTNDAHFNAAKTYPSRR